ncbi:MAG: insulinase family protein [Bacteroidetes bacterium]|nr:insulinase family protein [Bacteroidota bacterium]
MIQNKLSLAVLLIGAACFINAQTKNQPNDALPIDAKVRYGTLPNGMKYFIRHNAKPEKRAELRLAVNSGATNESDEQQGLAHFVEHMAFNGSKNFKKNDLVNYLEGIGTKFGPDLNAYTSFDETVYMLQIPTDKADIYKKGFLILEDWAHNLLFDSAEVEKERGVVMEEWRLGQGAFERMTRKTLPEIFKDSRYANRLPIGKPEVLQHCKQHFLRDYYRDWYRPDLQAIIVVGDIDVDATEKLVKERFSKIPSVKNPRPLTAWQIPDQKGFRALVVSDKESPYNILQLNYLEPKNSFKTYNDFRENLKIELYNGMLSARLSELARKPNAPFLFSGAGFNDLLRNKSSYAVFAVFPNGKAENALEAAVTENERVKRFGFTATEFERRKKQLLTDAENNFNEKDKTESKSIVREIVQYFLVGDAFTGAETDYQYTKDLLPSITLDEINALAKGWIRPKGDNALAVFMMAEKEGNKIPTNDEVIAIFNKAEANTDIKPYVDNVINEALVAKRPRGQKAIKSIDKGYGITELTLGNGLRILLKPTDFKDDEILLSANSWGGTNLYSDKDYYNANYSNAVQSMMGYGKFDATALDKYLDGKTAQVNLSVGPLSENINGSSNKKDFETMLQLVYVAFTKARKDSSAFNAFIQSQKGMLQNMNSDPGKVFQDTVSYVMANYNMRSKPVTEKEISSVDMDKTNQIFKERFSDPTDFVFTLVGSFNIDSIKPLLEAYLGGISAPMKHENCIDIGEKSAKGNITKTVVKGKNPRSTVQLMWTGNFDFNRKNRFETRALSQLLNITLRENLREDKGGVYGVGIRPQYEHFPKGAYKFTCSFSCAPDNVEKLIAAAKEEVEKVKKDGCNAINLGKIKETLLKERETQLKENNFWLSVISQADAYNEQVSEIDQYTAWVNNLKGEDFKKLANTYLNDSEFKRFVLNPEK